MRAWRAMSAIVRLCGLVALFLVFVVLFVPVGYLVRHVVDPMRLTRRPCATSYLRRMTA